MKPTALEGNDMMHIDIQSMIRYLGCVKTGDALTFQNGEWNIKPWDIFLGGFNFETTNPINEYNNPRPFIQES